MLNRWELLRPSSCGVASLLNASPRPPPHQKSSAASGPQRCKLHLSRAYAFHWVELVAALFQYHSPTSQPGNYLYMKYNIALRSKRRQRTAYIRSETASCLTTPLYSLALLPISVMKLGFHRCVYSTKTRPSTLMGIRTDDLTCAELSKIGKPVLYSIAVLKFLVAVLLL